MGARQPAAHAERAAAARVEPLLAVIRARLANASPATGDLDARYRRLLAALFADPFPELEGAAPDELGPLYEALLGHRLVRERGALRLRPDAGALRRSGSYYTPAWVAKLAVEETVGALLAEGVDPGGLRVLDPAMGAGVFLLAAARRLGSAPAELCGIDRDGGAVAAARLALERASWGGRARLLVGDALLGEIPRPGRPPAPLELECGRMDAVLGNPPFLHVKRGALRPLHAQLRARFRSARGQWDAWALFLELALAALRPGGRLGLVLPRPFLAAQSYAGIRRALLTASRVERIIELGAVFPSAGVEAVVCVARKRGDPPRRPRPLRFIDATRRPPVARAGPACRAFLRLPHAAIAPAAGRAEMAFLFAMQRAPARLGDLVHIARGLECGKRDRAVFAEDAPGRVPLLTGECVDRFRIEVPAFVDLAHVPATATKRAAFASGRPRVLVRRVAAELKAAVDESGALALNTLYLLAPREPAPPDLAHCLAALLNSGPLRRYHRLAFAADDRLFPYVRISQLEALPFPARARLEGPEAGQLAQLARRAAADPRRVDMAEIDALAERLYGVRARSGSREV
ncbi:MAG: N-6 DNA methylase [Planctomycetes bacterium]|nr:N-6 DNA methylase [Planctomycetota bacterium]